MNKSKSSKQKETASQTILPSKEVCLSEIREELPAIQDKQEEKKK